MPNLTSLPAGSPTEDILEIVNRDGAIILTGALNGDQIDALTAELQPLIDHTANGGDDFSGKATQRTGALVARSALTRELVMNQEIRRCAESFLGPFTDKIVLHLTQTININPSKGEQVLHRDRLAWGKHLPLSIEPQLNTIWALTDFTEQNGATRVVPGSQKWDWDQHATPEQICQAVMPRGSVLLYTGTVIHSGGCNNSSSARLGLNITYCLGWLRQEENQYLSCPPHIAKDLPEELQDLLGYTMGNYALGYYSDPEPSLDRANAAGILPPEAALGRKPTAAISITNEPQ